MSLSPPSRRLASVSPSVRHEELINAYEAEEERIINVLSRKLEQLREEKIGLENALEAESESHVNRMARELTALRLAQQQQSPSTQRQQQQACPNELLDALRRENEHLRRRLADSERGSMRITRLNEMYRKELIDHRRRLGISVDNLIGLASDPFAQARHRIPSSPGASPGSSSPSTSVLHMSSYPLGHPPRTATPGVPIPRPLSQIRRPVLTMASPPTPPSQSPSSPAPFPFSPYASPSPFSFSSHSSHSPFSSSYSPAVSTQAASYVSTGTEMTSPASSLSANANLMMGGAAHAHALSYPSVPPPSLSSSFGSPNISYELSPHDRGSGGGGGFGGTPWEDATGALWETSTSPMEPVSRHHSVAARSAEARRQSDAGRRLGDARCLGLGDANAMGVCGMRNGAAGARRDSVERAGRGVVETATLAARVRGHVGAGGVPGQARGAAPARVCTGFDVPRDVDGVDDKGAGVPDSTENTQL